jgi:hypothetical protein
MLAAANRTSMARPAATCRSTGRRLAYCRVMDRSRLAALLSAGDGEAYASCLEHLHNGAELTVTDSPVPASNLELIYARRERHTHAKGIPTLGFAETVSRLRALGDPLLSDRSRSLTRPITTVCFSPLTYRPLSPALASTKSSSAAARPNPAAGRRGLPAWESDVGWRSGSCRGVGRWRVGPGMSSRSRA